jgi:hypothetical protein
VLLLAILLEPIYLVLPPDYRMEARSRVGTLANYLIRQLIQNRRIAHPGHTTNGLLWTSVGSHWSS